MTKAKRKDKTMGEQKHQNATTAAVVGTLLLCGAGFGVYQLRATGLEVERKVEALESNVAHQRKRILDLEEGEAKKTSDRLAALEEQGKKDAQRLDGVVSFLTQAQQAAQQQQQPVGKK
jgi:hypothetical protein